MEKGIKVPSLEVLRIALAEVSLAEFVYQAQEAMFPNTPFVRSWYIEATCEHLQAVFEGKIRNLIINIPPRHGKSLIACVYFPAWVWVKEPRFKWLFSSYAAGLAIRDSARCRRVIQSNWYQGRWGDRYKIHRDQNQKARYENDKGGARQAIAVAGSNTGEGGDLCLVDDPHNVMEVESDVIRAGTINWYDEVMPTRLNDPKTGRRVVIMHRSHENDLTGHILSKGGEVTHLCLPARYTHKSVCTLGVKDPRKEVGEPLCPERFGEEELSKLELEMTPYAVACQLQQDPKPRTGTMFLVEKMTIINGVDRNLVEDKVRYWDKGEGEGCPTVGVLMYKMKDGGFVVADVVRMKRTAASREATIKQVAAMDGLGVKIFIEQEPGSGGSESAKNSVRNLAGFLVYKDKVQGSKKKPKDKVSRAEPFSIQVEVGNVSIIKGEWNSIYLNELRAFPNSFYKDQVDASSGAFNKLSEVYSRSGTW